jgi:transposase InsO family protein
VDQVSVQINRDRLDRRDAGMRRIGIWTRSARNTAFLAMEWFRNRIEAKIVIDDWRTHYNEVRPHSSLNYETPLAFRRRVETGSTTAIVSREAWS